MNGYFDEFGHPRVILELEGLTKESLRVSCLIDTGFDGYLTLPQSMGIRLGLPLFGSTTIELADGSRRVELLYFCKLKFENEERFIPVSLSSSRTPLFGTKLLAGRRLLMNFKDKKVKITKLKTAGDVNKTQQLKLMRKQIVW